MMIHHLTQKITRQLCIGVIFSLGAASYTTHGIPALYNQNRLTITTLPELFDKNDFGRALKGKVEETIFYYNGAQSSRIFKVIVAMPRYKLHAGDYIYVDLLHNDHLEVFNKEACAKLVLNLDGSTNRYKTSIALCEKRLLRLTLYRKKCYNKNRFYRSYSIATQNALSGRLWYSGFNSTWPPMKRFSMSTFSCYKYSLVRLKQWLLRRFI